MRKNNLRSVESPIISPADPPVLSAQVKRTEKAAVNRIKPPERTRRY